MLNLVSKLVSGADIATDVYSVLAHLCNLYSILFLFFVFLVVATHTERLTLLLDVTGVEATGHSVSHNEAHYMECMFLCTSLFMHTATA